MWNRIKVLLEFAWLLWTTSIIASIGFEMYGAIGEVQESYIMELRHVTSYITMIALIMMWTTVLRDLITKLIK